MQIGLINELARICDKHQIKWFAYGGTLLGAVRHKGFIPWDDDVDVIMLRPDYEKFKKVCAEEIKYPFFFDNWHSHRLENEELQGIKSDPNLPLIKLDKSWFGYPTSSMIKLRDSRTSMIEFPDKLTANQGIWIDVFPLDPIPPFSEKQQAITFEISKLLLLATVRPELIENLIQNGQKFILPQDELENLIHLSFNEKGLIYDSFAFENFSKSVYVGNIDAQCYSIKAKDRYPYQLKWLDDVVYLPFEKIQIPAPIGWNEFLTTQYGADWHTPKIFATHTVENWSADIPYDEYYKKIHHKT